METGWALRFRNLEEDEEGSPVQAWMFFGGFLVFPVWWVGGWVWRVPRTRELSVDGRGHAHAHGAEGEQGQGHGEGDLQTRGNVSVRVEKGVMLDDPKIEFDAKSWRFRCRVMSIVSLFTYIPFIVLVAVFVGRR